LRGLIDIDLNLYYPKLKVELGKVEPLYLRGDTWHNEALLDLQPF